MVTVFDASVVELGKIGDHRGCLTVIETQKQVPFDINRVFYLYGVPDGKSRGAHAHKTCHQFLIAVSGSLEVVVDDGKDKRTVALDRPDMGIHIPPGIWASEQNFSGDAVCLVLASHLFDESDYICEYDEFLKYTEDNR